MFGLSAAKIALLIAVAAAVIFGARLVHALGRANRIGPDAKPDPVETESATLEPCPRCGAYVDPKTHRCAS